METAHWQKFIPVVPSTTAAIPATSAQPAIPVLRCLQVLWALFHKVTALNRLLDSWLHSIGRWYYKAATHGLTACAVSCETIHLIIYCIFGLTDPPRRILPFVSEDETQCLWSSSSLALFRKYYPSGSLPSHVGTSCSLGFTPASQWC